MAWVATQARCFLKLGEFESESISKVKSTTHGLRFHDLRHHAVTELAESQASDQTIMSIAGHISPKMLALYSHVRMHAKRKAGVRKKERKGSYR